MTPFTGEKKAYISLSPSFYSSSLIYSSFSPGSQGHTVGSPHKKLAALFIISFSSSKSNKPVLSALQSFSGAFFISLYHLDVKAIKTKNRKNAKKKTII